jgi:hypothetical protein
MKDSYDVFLEKAEESLAGAESEFANKRYNNRMSRKQSEQLDPRMVSAIDELIAMITARYPDAQFEVVYGVDEPESIDLITTVDINEIIDVIDLVIDRLLELQVEERLPIHVIPIRPLERVIAATQPARSPAAAHG